MALHCSMHSVSPLLCVILIVETPTAPSPEEFADPGPAAERSKASSIQTQKATRNNHWQPWKLEIHGHPQKRSAESFILREHFAPGALQACAHLTSKVVTSSGGNIDVCCRRVEQLRRYAATFTLFNAARLLSTLFSLAHLRCWSWRKEASAHLRAVG